MNKMEESERKPSKNHQKQRGERDEGCENTPIHFLS